MAHTLYETMFLHSPELAETAVKKEIETLKTLIAEKFEGKITFEDFWGKRDLAYPIKKKDAGFYTVLQYTFPGDKMAEFDEELRLDLKILRHLTIKPPVDVAPVKYSEALTEEEEFTTEKAAGKRKVRRISNRKESLDKK